MEILSSGWLIECVIIKLYFHLIRQQNSLFVFYWCVGGKHYTQPLGRQYGAAIFRACAVTICRRRHHGSCCDPEFAHAYQIICIIKARGLCPLIRSSLPHQMYNYRNGDWFGVQHNEMSPLGIMLPRPAALGDNNPSGWHSIMLASKPVTICILLPRLRSFSC